VTWRACFVVMLLSLFSWCGGGVQAKPMSEVHGTRSSPADPFARFIAEASQRFGIPGRWIRAVMHVESGNRPRETSSKGAIGLMQIMPRTWNELRARYGFGRDPYDRRDNILAGTAYLSEMRDRYGAPG